MVKPSTALPSKRMPASFQYPYMRRSLTYSSARFAPPVYAVSPSMTTILRWSRKLRPMLRLGTILLKARRRTPFWRMSRFVFRRRVEWLPMSS